MLYSYKNANDYTLLRVSIYEYVCIKYQCKKEEEGEGGWLCDNKEIGRKIEDEEKKKNWW